MSMMTNTLGRYFAGRFVISALGVFASALRFQPIATRTVS